MATPPDFSPGQVLTAAHMDAVGLWLVKTQAVGSGVASVTVTGAFSADYDNYRITWSGGTLSSNQVMLFQLSGSTVNYYTSWAGAFYTGAAITTGLGFNNTSSWGAGGGDATTAAVNIDVLGPYLTKATNMRFSGDFVDATISGAGRHTPASSFTGFVLFGAGGATMTGGTIRVYGYRN